jgi:hypothetical protein
VSYSSPHHRCLHLPLLILSIYVSDGELFLASSQLSYRQWNGSVWRYSNPDSAPDVERCDAGYELACGIHDLKLIPNTNRIIAGLDSGKIFTNDKFLCETGLLGFREDRYFNMVVL